MFVLIKINFKKKKKTNQINFFRLKGKYMNIEFDYAGQAVGGQIISYLLEKSRVVHQNEGDQNFHIFYQLISGLDELNLKKLQLRRDPSVYYYLNQGETAIDYNIDDSKQFIVVKNALKVFDFTEIEEESIYKIIASIIHMGQVGFFEGMRSDKNFSIKNLN